MTDPTTNGHPPPRPRPAGAELRVLDHRFTPDSDDPEAYATAVDYEAAHGPLDAEGWPIELGKEAT